MKTILKVVIGIIVAFIIMGMLFVGCTAFVFNEADKEITKQDKKDKEEAKKEYPVGTTKTLEDRRGGIAPAAGAAGGRLDRGRRGAGGAGCLPAPGQSRRGPRGFSFLLLAF